MCLWSLCHCALFMICYFAVACCQNAYDKQYPCFSTTDCRGFEVLQLNSNSGASQCCMTGVGLSFIDNSNGGECVNCFSDKTFQNLGDNFHFGLFSNFDPGMYFRVANIRIAVDPVDALNASFSLEVLGEKTLHTAPVEITMNSNNVSVSTDSIRDQAIFIKSETGESLSVVVYAEEFTSSDTFKVFPPVYLPDVIYEYYTVSIPDNISVDDALQFEPPQGNNAIVIVTTEPETTLTLAFTQRTTFRVEHMDQINSGVINPFTTVILTIPNRAQTLYFSSLVDLTGSLVLSNKPVSFISGYECAAISNNLLHYCDQMLEQIPPTATWGKTFITAPIATRRQYDIFRFIASRDSTFIKLACVSNQVPSLSLNAGEFDQVQIPSTQSCYIEASQPILVMQYSVSSSIDNVFQGDFFMVIVPPIEQYRSSYTIRTFPTNVVFTGPGLNYVNVLLPGGVDPSGVRLNGKRVESKFTQVPCIQIKGFCGSTSQILLNNDNETRHTLNHTDPSISLSAIVYWLSFRVGIGYLAGMTQFPIALPSISIVSTVLRPLENASVAQIVLTRSGDLSTTASVHVQTMELTGEDSAIANEDFIPVDEIFKFAPEGNDTFAVFLSASPGVLIKSPAYATIVIMNDDSILPDIQVNDTVISPFMTVPISVSKDQLAALNTTRLYLCFEIHGRNDQWFNFITDECASVNALYTGLSRRLNVISKVGVRAVDSNGQCINILVDINNCSATVNGAELLIGRYSSDKIRIRRYSNRVRISVPNCAELTLVMWVICERRTLDNPAVPDTQITSDTIKFVVMRGLNFGHRQAHGILGQFWNIPVDVTPYTGLDRNGEPAPGRYIVNITTGDNPRSYTGWLYNFSWEFKEGTGPCLYVGNRQSGPIYEIQDPNDGVIAGLYTDYAVNSAFSEENYDFGLFNENRCIISALQ